MVKEGINTHNNNNNGTNVYIVRKSVTVSQDLDLLVGCC